MFLGIDTSNYKTSLGLVNKEGEVLRDLRKPLSVPLGSLGLRQQEAVFQHLANLPELFQRISDLNIKEELLSVSASTKPRPIEDSYMPCFKAGEAFARTVSSFLGIPYLSFSHQEGHLAAAFEKSKFADKKEFLAFHLSGGTLEILLIKEGITLLGGTKDISYGQVLDRLGTLMGIPFPSGEQLSLMAEEEKEASTALKAVYIKEGAVNLSGFDTQIQRVIKNGDISPGQVVKEVFNKIGDSIISLSRYYFRETGIGNVLMTGGVSASSYLRKYIHERSHNTGVNFDFSDSSMSSDNAVGTAYLGRRVIWNKSPYPFQSLTDI